MSGVIDGTDIGEIAGRLMRERYPRLLALLSRTTRDRHGAEDFLSEAFAAALVQWPKEGVPDNIDGWLLTVARRRHRDNLRRRRVRSDAAATVRLMQTEMLVDTGGGDRRVDLLFACAHPEIDRKIQPAFMLQMVFCLSAADISRVYLVSPASMSQRLVRTKTHIKRSGLRFDRPGNTDRRRNIDAVLEAIYGAWMFGNISNNVDLTREALSLAAEVADAYPSLSEPWGLLALLHYLDRSDDGNFERAEKFLHRAAGLGSPGRFQLEAAVQSACSMGWPEQQDRQRATVSFYAILGQVTGSPVIWLYDAAAKLAVFGVDMGRQELAEASTSKTLARCPRSRALLRWIAQRTPGAQCPAPS